MRKMISILVAITMLIAVIPSVALAVDFYTSMELSVDDDEPAKVGDTLETPTVDNIDELENVKVVHVENGVQKIEFTVMPPSISVYYKEDGELEKASLYRTLYNTYYDVTVDEDGEEIDKEILNSSRDFYVYFNQPGKANIGILGRIDGNPVIYREITLEATGGDEREAIELTNITVGGQQVKGFSPERKEYEVTLTELDTPTVVGTKQLSSDQITYIPDKNCVYIVVSNSQKTLAAMYKVLFKYQVDGTLTLETNETWEAGEYFAYKVKLNGNDITQYADLNIAFAGGETNDANSWVVQPGVLKTVQPGGKQLTATLDIVTDKGTEKTLESEPVEITVEGEQVLDTSERHNNLSEVSPISPGDIVTAMYWTDEMEDDTRWSIESSDESIIAVAGNKWVGLKEGQATITLRHKATGAPSVECEVIPAAGTVVTNIYVDETSVILRPDQEYTVRYTTNNTDAYDQEVKFEITTGQNICMQYGNTIIPASPGQVDVKISCGIAEQYVTIKVVENTVVVPEEIKIKASSETFLTGKPNVLTITIEPEGSDAGPGDLIVTLEDPNDDTKLSITGDWQFSVTPYSTGKHMLIFEVPEYSLIQEFEFTATGMDIKPEDVVPVESVELSSHSVSIERGNTKTIRATVKPSNATNKELMWVSDDEEIATVTQAGRITGKTRGETTIRVFCITNPEIEDSVRVNVYRKGDSYDDDDDYDDDDGYRYPVDRVEIYKDDNGKETAIRNGKVEIMDSLTQQFVAKIYPYNATNQEVRWYTDDANIADVSEDGLVTTYRKGTCNLTVVTRDGNKRCTIEISVVDLIVKPTAVKIIGYDNNELPTAVKTGDQLRMKVSFEPIETTERFVTWSVAKGINAVSLASDGTITFNDVGEAEIRVYTRDYNTSASITFNISYGPEFWTDCASVGIQSPNDGKEISSRKPVEIQFTQPIQIQNIADGNIYVSTNRYGNNVAGDIVMELSSDGKKLTISSKTGRWNSGTTYYVFMKSKTVSQSGYSLGINLRYEFNVR